MNLLSNIYSWLGYAQPITESEKIAIAVQLGGLPVGTLRAENGEWVFVYSAEFLKQNEIKPIVDFPNLNREYRSKTLWPFFALRIPSPAQAAVQEFMHNRGISEVDQGTLLKRFGRKSIANPFELVPLAA